MRRYVLFLLVIGSFFLIPSTIYANPTGPTVVNGQAGFATPNPGTLEITNTPGAIINWQGFSIQASELTRFVQQSTASSVLNRVTGPDPSHILGQLHSNGRVFLINPHGMVFGPGAVIDTAGFMASTYNITDEDFLKGNLNFFGGPDSGSIANQGFITAGSGGDIYLIAPDIQNSGIITTDGGNIVLAAGEQVTLTGEDLKGVNFEIQAPEHTVVNLGRIQADGGAAGLFAGTLEMKGEVRAGSVAFDERGQIVLQAAGSITLGADSSLEADGPRGGLIRVESKADTTLAAGSITARGTEGEGGRIALLGKKVGLTGQASVDVSGETGGGTVLIGGDFQGKNPDISNALRTYVGGDASISADAVQSGDGGTVIVWADEATGFYGHVSARGGLSDGNGGFTEISGNCRSQRRGPLT